MADIMWQSCKNILVGIVFSSLVLLYACGKWPDIVESKADIEALPLNVTSIRARGLADGDIPSLIRLQGLEYIFFDMGNAVKEAKITDRGLKYLSELQLPVLQLLMLGYCNKITDGGLQYVAKISTIKQLGLSNCPGISDNGLKYLTSMGNLEHLDVRECQKITDSGMEIVSEIMNLQWLNIGGCKNITDSGLAKLTKMTKLKIIDLEACPNITDQGIMSLAELQSLKSLDITKCTKVSENIVQRFQLIRPDCKIERRSGY